MMTPGFFCFFSFRNSYSLEEVDFRAVDGEHTHMVYGWTLAPPDIWIETFQGEKATSENF